MSNSRYILEKKDFTDMIPKDDIVGVLKFISRDINVVLERGIMNAADNVNELARRGQYVGADYDAFLNLSVDEVEGEEDLMHIDGVDSLIDVSPNTIEALEKFIRLATTHLIDVIPVDEIRAAKDVLVSIKDDIINLDLLHEQT